MSHFAEGTDSGESPAVSSLSLQGCFLFFRTRPLSGFCYSPVGNREGGPPSLLSRLESERRREGGGNPFSPPSAFTSSTIQFRRKQTPEKKEGRGRGEDERRRRRRGRLAGISFPLFLFSPTSPAKQRRKSPISIGVAVCLYFYF